MKTNSLLYILTAIMFLSFHTSHRINVLASDKELFKVSILYPSGEGKTFDMSYYENKHMPMVAAALGKNLMWYEIENGISGRTSNDPAPFIAAGYFYVKSIPDYNNAIATQREVIVNDIKNYTNISPTIQISKVIRVAKND